MAGGKASAKKIELAERRRLAVTLRKQGGTFRQIAEQLRKVDGVSENYSQSENLVARGDSGIVAPRGLIGKKVGVPFGTTAHYRLMGILETFGIAENQLKIIDLSNPDVLPAFIRKDIDAGCAWEPAVGQMLENGGRILVSSEDQIRWGFSTYGLVAVNEAFAKENRDLVVKFLKVMDESTRIYHSKPDQTYAPIGKMAGITPEKTKEIMSSMGFYSKEAQLSGEWMGTKAQPGMTAKQLKKVAEQGPVPTHVLAVGRRVSAADRDRLQKALLALHAPQHDALRERAFVSRLVEVDETEHLGPLEAALALVQSGR